MNIRNLIVSAIAIIFLAGCGGFVGVDTGDKYASKAEIELLKKEIKDLKSEMEISSLLGMAEGAKANIYPYTGGLTGGGTGALDKTTGTNDGDAAIVLLSDHATWGNAFMPYALDVDGGNDEDPPWIIDSGDGGGAATVEDWELLDGRFNNMFSKISIDESNDATVDISSLDYKTGTFFINTDGAQEYDLPANPTGLVFCFANDEDSTGAITIDPDDADYIILDGAAESAGEAIVSTGAIEDQVCIIGIDASYWKVTGYLGTWDGAVD
jgi:hypothetical protein